MSREHERRRTARAPIQAAAEVRLVARLVLFLGAVFLPLTGSAQTAAEPGQAQEVIGEEGLEPLGRMTPRSTVEGFLRAIDEDDPAKAAEYLDLRNLPPQITQYTPEQLARGLAIVLERGVWFDLEQLSQSEEGHSGDQLPSYRDLLIELPTPEKNIRILLQRVPDGEGGRIWKFSNATIAELDVLYESYRYNDFVEWLATELPDVSFLTIDLFKWVTVLLAVLAAAPFVLLISWLMARTLVAPDRPLHASIRRFLMGPLSTVVLILVADQTLTNLGIGLAAQEMTRSYTLITAAMIWLLWQAVNLFRDVYSQRLASLGRGSSIALLRPLANALKLIILLLGVLVWLDNLDFQITAVLTGLGIGGVRGSTRAAEATGRRVWRDHPLHPATGEDRRLRSVRGSHRHCRGNQPANDPDSDAGQFVGFGTEHAPGRGADRKPECPGEVSLLSCVEIGRGCVGPGSGGAARRDQSSAACQRSGSGGGHAGTLYCHYSGRLRRVGVCLHRCGGLARLPERRGDAEFRGARPDCCISADPHQSGCRFDHLVGVGALVTCLIECRHGHVVVPGCK